jgi:hypothetical protein
MQATIIDATLAPEIEQQLAEFLILDAYDRKRTFAGHDYGGSRRRGEVYRRLDALAPVDVYRATRSGRPDVSREAIADAWNRVAAPRIRRLQTQPDGGGTRRSLATWQRVRADVCAGLIR